MDIFDSSRDVSVSQESVSAVDVCAELTAATIETSRLAYATEESHLRKDTWQGLVGVDCKTLGLIGNGRV